jgi:hypothetical protein
MASKPLSQLDITELQKQQSRLKSILISCAIMWIILLLLNIYIMIFRDTNLALMAVSVSLLPTLLPLLTALNKVNAEIKLRNSDI